MRLMRSKSGHTRSLIIGQFEFGVSVDTSYWDWPTERSIDIRAGINARCGPYFKVRLWNWYLWTGYLRVSQKGRK